MKLQFELAKDIEYFLNANALEIRTNNVHTTVSEKATLPEYSKNNPSWETPLYLMELKNYPAIDVRIGKLIYYHIPNEGADNSHYKIELDNYYLKTLNAQITNLLEI